MSTIAQLTPEQKAHCIAEALGGRVNGNRKGMCRCPAHDDKTPSLEISVTSDKSGRDWLNFRCFAKCSDDEIKNALHARGLWHQKIVKTYRYENESGQLLYEKVRYEPKDFGARRWDARGFWINSIKGVERVLYNLRGIAGDGESAHKPVLYCEGEKDVDALISRGFLATTAGSVTSWQDKFAETLAGRDVVLCGDNDEEGRKHVEEVARALHGKAKRLRVVTFPSDYRSKKIKDVSDFFDAGGDVADLQRMIDVAPVFVAPKEEASRAEASPRANEPEIIGLHTWLQTPPKPIEHIVENAFGPGDKVLVVGKAKTCKSFALGQLGLSLSAGKDFLFWKVRKPRRVLCVQLEITAEWFKRRCWAMCHALGIDDKRNFYILNGRGIQPTIEKFDPVTKEEKASPVGWIEWLLSSRELFTLKPEVIIIDPIYKVEAFDELSTVQVKEVLAGLDRLTAETGAAVVYCHHDRKGVAGDLDLVDRGSGSGVFGRDWDALFALSEHAYDPKVTVLHAAFRNFASPREPYAVEFHYPIFIPSDEAAIPRTSDYRNPTSAVDLETFDERALVFLREKPIPVTMFKSHLESKADSGLKLTQTRARALFDSLKQKGLIAVHRPQRKPGSMDLVGLAEHIAELEREANNG